MTIEEIVHGESKNVEFKVSLPEKSEKYTKTIVAFANTQGGQLIIGVEDDTREVAGVDRDDVFRIMDSIANAVSDSCTPQIVPNIELQTVDGRTLIVVAVAPGPNRPYYLKAKGKEAGTYIRVAGTTRPADPDRIKELEMEGARISWDELTCVGYEVKPKAIKKLCNDIIKYRKRENLPNREVTDRQLVNWKLLKDVEGGYLASNAFVLLTSDYYPFSKTQCAVFKGTERSVFLDKREFTGPLYEQIEEATTFVLRNIRLGAVIDGLVRKESYELPLAAIREMIINAHCHRNLQDESCIQVAIYDDRLEVTSPGGLYNGITYEEIMNGHSKLRNKVIADVFSQMGLVEAWGTGIKRILEASEEWKLPTPEFQAFDNMFRVELFRNNFAPIERHNNFVIGVDGVNVSTNGIDIGVNGANVDAVGGKSDVNILSEKELRLIQMIEKDGTWSIKEMSEMAGMSRRTVDRTLKQLKEKGLITRVGSPRKGYWKAVK